MSVIDPEIWEIVRLSLLVSGASVAISSLVGIPLGVWLGSNGRAGRFVRALVQTGMALPPVVVGLALYTILSREGPLGPLGWLFTPQAMVIAQTILALPFVVGITMASVAAVPSELPVQLRGLGASDRDCRRAVLREARPGAILAVAAAFGRSISEVGAVLLVGGNIQGQTRVLTTAIVLETGKGRFGFALTLGAVLLTLALTVNLALARPRAGRPIP